METIVLANLFAEALDEEDYPKAAACLAASCVYETPEETYYGPDAIIGSYREHGEWAARNLETVRYESAVRNRSDGEVTVEFLDHIEHAGVAHTYRCEQRLTFDDLGRISRIKHVDLPGERDRLRLFFRQVGLNRSHISEENG